MLGKDTLNTLVGSVAQVLPKKLRNSRTSAPTSKNCILNRYHVSCMLNTYHLWLIYEEEAAMRSLATYMIKKPTLTRHRSAQDIPKNPNSGICGWVGCEESPRVGSVRLVEHYGVSCHWTSPKTVKLKNPYPLNVTLTKCRNAQKLAQIQ